MKRTTIGLAVAALFCGAQNVLAQGVTGSVSVTGIAADVDSSNRFRFEEYRDLSDGFTAGTDLRRDDDGGRMQLFSENLGRDDQFIELSGRRYGLLRYSLYNNRIVHNLTYDAITPYSGIGTNNLTFPGALGATPSTNIATWNRFDYGIRHDNFGGTFEVKPWASPYYFRATANQKQTQGLKPIGNAGTSPGGPTIELPAVVDYTTTDASAEAGYATRSSQYSLNFSWSKFDDKNNFYTWRNPVITNAASTTTTETTTIAADNSLWKVALNAMWKQLPMSSTLALRGTYSRLTNDLAIPTTSTAVTGTTGQIVATNPSNGTFNGDVVYKTLSASLTSQLARALDSRFYYNFNEKENESTHVVFRPVNQSTGLPAQTCDLNPGTGTTTGITTCTNELFHYTRHNVGVDLQYRLDPRNKLSAGWDFADTERERIDFDKTRDNRLTLEWKNGYFEDLTARLKYQHLWRDSEFKLGDLNPALSNNNLFNRYVKRFDLVDADQDLVKLALDSSPARFLDLGAEAIFKQNRYKGVELGRNEDTRQEIYLSAAYGDPQRWRLSTFFDYETTRYDSTHYQGAPNPATFPAAVSATIFQWKANVKDRNYVAGIAADWLPITRLKLRTSFIYQETEGTVDFAANHPAAVIVNIPAYDSFTKTTLDLKAIYEFSRTLEVTVGAAHERFRYSDAQMDGYNYTIVTGTTQNFLSGAYAFPNYNAWIGYLTLKYHLR